MEVMYTNQKEAMDALICRQIRRESYIIRLKPATGCPGNNYDRYPVHKCPIYGILSYHTCEVVRADRNVETMEMENTYGYTDCR